MTCCLVGNQHISNALLCEPCLHLGTCNDFHDILGLQETFHCSLYYLDLDIPFDILIVEDGLSFPVQLVEGKVPAH